MKERYPKPSKALLAFMKLTGWLPAMVYYKPKCYYVNKQKQGRKLPKSCIVMSNHTSLMDYPLHMLLFCSRIPRFLMAEVLFRIHPMFAKFLFAIGGIYVNRDQHSFAFIHQCLDILNKGGIVGIYPEGRLPVKGKRWPFKPGITQLALKTDAPIIPICTDGNYGLFKRAHVLYGEPIYLKEHCTSESPSKEEIKALTGMLEEKMNQLREELEQRKRGSR